MAHTPSVRRPADRIDDHVDRLVANYMAQTPPSQEQIDHVARIFASAAPARSGDTAA